MGVVLALFVLVVILLVVLIGSIYRIDQQSVGIIERNGRFRHIAQPGLHFKMPVIDRVAGRLSLRQRNLDVTLDAMTKDNATAQLAH